MVWSNVGKGSVNEMARVKSGTVAWAGLSAYVFFWDFYAMRKQQETLTSAFAAQATRPNMCLQINMLVANENNQNIIPARFSLAQNYPNPFNPTTSIKFGIPKQAFVKLVVYDVTGREISTLVNELKKAGTYEAPFNGTNLASGVYFYRIEAGDFMDVKKMVLVE